MFEFPVELSSLTIAKKFLIQRVSPLIPVIHIKNGIMGSRGHKEGRAFRNNFIVNKNRVQNALVWLQKYSILYQKKN